MTKNKYQNLVKKFEEESNALKERLSQKENRD